MESLEFSEVIQPDVLAVLEKGIADNAKANSAPPYAKRELMIVRRNGEGKIVAGLTGETFWNWLYIDVLWVDAKDREQGIGSKLVEAAEKEAISRGCHSSYLWTENYEGRDFYSRLGYKEFVVKQDFPIGYQRIGFMKRLVERKNERDF